MSGIHKPKVDQIFEDADDKLSKSMMEVSSFSKTMKKDLRSSKPLKTQNIEYNDEDLKHLQH